MPNVASVLKTEISRVARKEVRGETLPLKKAVSAYRLEIAALKRRAQAFEQALRRLSKLHINAAPAVAPEEDSGKSRFSAKSLSSQRRRLGLSAAQCGLLPDRPDLALLEDRLDPAGGGGVASHRQPAEGEGGAA